MSQRESGYERVDRDLYETPEWATLAIVPHLGERLSPIWEPACGSGKMVRALESRGFPVVSTDIATGDDFLAADEVPRGCIIIVTNPPYKKATQFIERALELTKPSHGAVAMLLRTDFDHAKSRRHLFADCRSFAKKVILTKRIVWFDRPGAAPSFNHAWFLWDWTNVNQPELHYDFQD